MVQARSAVHRTAPYQLSRWGHPRAGDRNPLHIDEVRPESPVLRAPVTRCRRSGSQPKSRSSTADQWALCRPRSPAPAPASASARRSRWKRTVMPVFAFDSATCTIAPFQPTWTHFLGRERHVRDTPIPTGVLRLPDRISAVPGRGHGGGPPRPCGGWPPG